MEKNFLIKNQLGLHARAAAKWVQVSNQFESQLTVQFDGQEVDGKSILNVLTLACPAGAEITVRAEGEDAAQMLKALERLVEEKFGED
jgi:phosphocarrier protein